VHKSMFPNIFKVLLSLSKSSLSGYVPERDSLQLSPARCLSRTTSSALRVLHRLRGAGLSVGLIAGVILIRAQRRVRRFGLLPIPAAVAVADCGTSHNREHGGAGNRNNRSTDKFCSHA